MSQQPTSRPADPEQDRLLDHEYDGIREYDNPMPRWWVAIFWGTIVFSVAYLANVIPHLGVGPGRIARYETEMAEARASHPQTGPAASETELAALVHSQAAITAGRATFASNCAACHRADGGGLIGPNLTDRYWLHGGTLPEILHTVAEGVQAKGMPAWGKLLKPDQVTAVVAYIATMQGTNPPNAKAPQGSPIGVTSAND